MKVTALLDVIDTLLFGQWRLVEGNVEDQVEIVNVEEPTVSFFAYRLKEDATAAELADEFVLSLGLRPSGKERLETGVRVQQ